MMTQVASAAMPSQGFNAISTPAAVATPLPPWKRKNTGHRWPRKAARPTKAAAVSPRPKRGPYSRHTSTGT